MIILYDDMARQSTWLHHTKLSLILEILKILNYNYFVKIKTRKPKIGKLTNMSELCPFLESKSGIWDFVVT